MKRSEALLVANGALSVFYMHSCPEEREDFLAASRVINEMIEEEERKEKTA